MYQKVEQLDYGGGSHIVKSILMSHMMVIKNPQNVHKICFLPNFDDFHNNVTSKLTSLWMNLIVSRFFREPPPSSSCLTF